MHDLKQLGRAKALFRGERGNVGDDAVGSAMVLCAIRATCVTARYALVA